MATCEMPGIHEKISQRKTCHGMNEPINTRENTFLRLLQILWTTSKNIFTRMNYNLKASVGP